MTRVTGTIEVGQTSNKMDWIAVVLRMWRLTMRTDGTVAKVSIGGCARL
jgi:hypothetical protein